VNAKNVNDILDALAARFGTTATHLWTILIRQVYIQGITAIVGEAILLAGFLVLIGRWRVYQRRVIADEIKAGYGRPSCDLGDYPSWVLAFVVVGVANVVVLTLAIGYGVQMLNPEYGALTMVLSALSGH
jgi:hypothetical protein